MEKRVTILVIAIGAFLAFSAVYCAETGNFQEANACSMTLVFYLVVACACMYSALKDSNEAYKDMQESLKADEELISLLSADVTDSHKYRMYYIEHKYKEPEKSLQNTNIEKEK